MESILALIGFGEAGRSFATAGQWRARAYDCKTDRVEAAEAMRAAYARAGIQGASDSAAAVRDATLILSLVTADAALAAARAVAPALSPGALYCDMNSAAPDTKRAAAAAIAAAGGRYVDVAIMAPVEPARLAVPLALAGADAAEAAARLAALGFTAIEIVGPAIGDAAALKLIRSVFVKGLEAITAECLIAAERAGIADAVLASLARDTMLDAREADRRIERMLRHGTRRAAEMAEAARTLETLGVDPAMTRGTIERQRALGERGDAIPATLSDKLAVISERMP